MRKLAFIVLLSAFILPACEKQKPEIEMALPSAPPDVQNMQPTSPPPGN